MIQPAQPDQAAEICAVIRRSITELCVEDHDNNSDKLARWLENKTVENCQQWLFNDRSQAFVAFEGTQLVGVAHLDQDGFLHLCYVLASVMGLGVGKQLLQAVEAQARLWGLEEITLESTTTAWAFYKSQGYQLIQVPVSADGMLFYPMRKPL